MNIVDFDKLSEMFWDGNHMEIHKDDIPSIPSAFDGMTNGEVIQALFPNCVTGIDDEGWSITNIDGFTTFNPKWWNAPYKAEKEVLRAKRLRG